MSGNLSIYERCREVPEEAQKPFNNGRFSGTDINPMWRIKKLTELFGPSGIGWWTEDVKYWLEQGSDGTVAAFCSLSLRYAQGDKTSQPVHGIGGNVFVQKNRTSDEAFKMAYTDALSIAAKALGVGADIWFQNDRSKYEEEPEKPAKPVKPINMKDLFIAMGDAATIDELQVVVTNVWKKATLEEREKIRVEYDRLKAILEKKQ